MDVTHHKDALIWRCDGFQVCKIAKILASPPARAVSCSSGVALIWLLCGAGTLPVLKP